MKFQYSPARHSGAGRNPAEMHNPRSGQIHGLALLSKGFFNSTGFRPSPE
jgi:hypothetical protein